MQNESEKSMTLCRICTFHFRVHGGLFRNTVTYGMKKVPAPEAADLKGPVEEQFKYIIYCMHRSVLHWRQ
jgi:hypothetical protein